MLSSIKNETPLFHDFEFLWTPRPCPLGKKGPSAVNAPPPTEEQPGPGHETSH